MMRLPTMSKIRLQFQQLDSLEEDQLNALPDLELYRRNMVRAYDKLVKPQVFQKG